MASDPIIDAVESALPVVGQAKAGLEIVKRIGPLVGWALLALVLLLGMNTVFGWISDPFHLKAHALAKAQGEAATSKAVATQAQGQAAAAVSAAQIVAQGVEKHDLTIHLQQENSRAILAAPGAGQAVDPRLNDAGRRGLCRYSAYAADPDCAGLRQPDPGPGSEAGRGNAPAGP